MRKDLLKLNHTKPEAMSKYNIIGLMSGTSMDGVDLAHCTFENINEKIHYSVNIGETIPYPQAWYMRLRNLPNASAQEYAETHSLYGRYLGSLIKEFCTRHQLNANFVASHGHTIFHRPNKHYTSQIGEGAAIAALSGLPVVCDFRTGDVAHGGQGAPLVPIGDELLFGEFDYCLNLGGFANISYKFQNKRIAYDISPANIVLNYIANKAGKAYDKDGEMASGGSIDYNLLETLNNLEFYKQLPPKSLGREWLEEIMIPEIENVTLSDNNLLCTLTEHIAMQISTAVEGGNEFQKVLVTGGGAFNKYLIDRIKAHTMVKIELPSSEIIHFKEALVFAFLGLLRWQGKTNCLASVTGANSDCCGGAIYMP